MIFLIKIPFHDKGNPCDERDVHALRQRCTQVNLTPPTPTSPPWLQVLSRNHVIGIILAGGPHSVYEEGAPHVHAGVRSLGYPLLLSPLLCCLPLYLALFLLKYVPCTAPKTLVSLQRYVWRPLFYVNG